MTHRKPEMKTLAPLPLPAVAPKKLPAKAPARSPVIERLVAWRKKHDLTQRETAARLEINFDTYKSYECGHRNPGGPATLKILALIGALK